MTEKLVTQTTSAEQKPLRRKFLAGTAAATGAAITGFPMIATAQTGPVNMRWQSTWNAKDIFHEYALDFSKKVNDMSGGELKIEVLPAGAVVPAFGLLDAVSKGTLDGGHGVLVYHYGKQNALALWGSGPAFGMDANMLLSWHKYGGGKELLAKLYASINANVVSFPYGPMPTQPLGWFKKPITKSADFKGLKYRTVGISIDVFTAMGAAVNALPGGEIVPAMDRGLLDAAEFNNASSDRLLGFPDVSKVCMLQSYHQNAEQFEIMFNKAKYDALPAKLKATIEKKSRLQNQIEDQRIKIEKLILGNAQGHKYKDQEFTGLTPQMIDNWRDLGKTIEGNNLDGSKPNGSFATPRGSTKGGLGLNTKGTGDFEDRQQSPRSNGIYSDFQSVT